VIRTTPHRWMGLVLGLALMAAAVVILHRTSAVKDPVWAVLAHSRAQGLEADAYFYTEVGDVRAFLDARGRYGVERPDHAPAR
jgi:hypothetical protein